MSASESLPCECDQRMAAIRSVLAKAPAPFHAPFLQACLPEIYGGVDHWAKHSDLKLDVEKRHPYVLFSSSKRRWSEADHLATFVAALLAHVPGLRIAVFTIGK